MAPLGNQIVALLPSIKETEGEGKTKVTDHGGREGTEGGKDVNIGRTTSSPALFSFTRTAQNAINKGCRTRRGGD